ncbi:cilia- and flagella-associated protein 161 [Cochliomyia hominivorax]
MSLVSFPRYQPVVRLGNWFEDLCLEQDKINIFKNLRDTGELLVEKSRRLYDYLHKEIILEAPKENIRFGAIVQLMPCNFNICEYETTDVHPALSIVVNEHVVRHSQRLNEECELTIAPSVKTCVRNSFRIISSDAKERTNELLKYGQQFRLECVENDGDSLLLYSVQKSPDLNSMITSTFSSRKHGELNLKLGLCWKRNCGPGKLIPSAYTNWFCQHLDPMQRFESYGTPLPSNMPLVITHAATNRNLAAENVVIQTLFGPEFLVSVQNYKNIFKRETWKNIWMISNGHQFKSNS